MHPAASAAIALSLIASPVLAQSAPRIVTDVTPTAALVQSVLGDQGQAEVLLPQGSGAHHHQLRPSDAQALQSADLLVWMGPGLTPWLSRAAQNLSPADQQRLLDVPDLTLRAYGAGDDDHDHDHDHDHGHDHGGTDPHAWLDPDNAIIWLGSIAADLSRRDPGNAATYRANADAAIARIRAMDQDLARMLAPHADARFVVFHDAYGYFTDHYGLQPGLAISLGDASTPSAARISEIRQQVADSGATCAFPEVAHDPALLATVTEGTPLRMGAELSPEGAGIDGYEAMMTAMATTIAECLDGDQG